MKIGFCGLGKMGTEMVLRLLAAGHDVAVWNRTEAKLRPAIAAGAKAMPTPAAVAAGNEIVLLCLFDAASVEEVVFGQDGIASAGTPVLVVDHSSISPNATRDFAARLSAGGASEWVDAPVSGGVEGTAAGRLTVMAGGSATGIEKASVPVRAYAARVVRVGPVGAGQTAKVCNQAIVGATLLAIGETVALARNSGIDPARLTEILAGGWADSRLLQIFVPRMTSPGGAPIATLATLLKDIELVATLARDSGTPMPVAGAVQHALRMATTLEMGDADFSAIVQLFAGREHASDSARCAPDKSRPLSPG
ncbi:MAG: 2-hydroxy-3-oxopropionate reductase [Verrucomicrobia bacterium]|nr:2-hydroxy-3-oxopropionate reductase [Verrucomicrobiota bacterium]